MAIANAHLKSLITEGLSRQQLREAGHQFSNSQYAAMNREVRQTRRADIAITQTKYPPKSTRLFPQSRIVQTALPMSARYLYRGVAVLQNSQGDIQTFPVSFVDDERLDAGYIRANLRSIAQQVANAGGVGSDTGQEWRVRRIDILSALETSTFTKSYYARRGIAA